MSDYTLYYWSVPFRGQFVRAVLAHAGKRWTEGGDAAISKLMGGPVRDMASRSASSSQALLDEVRSLADLVQRFKVGGTSASVRRAA